MFNSSLVRKYWMAGTGLFLCSFLVIHLAGNLQLIWGTKEAFNEYTLFMTSFPLIKIISYVLYGSILLHAVDGILLTRQNKAARPEDYAYNNPGANSTWASRNMALLGIITLLFIVIHMKSFWYEMHWGSVGIDSNGNRDLHQVVIAAFQQWWYVAIYVVCMAALAFHLAHGFQSAFQTVGLNHARYTPIIKKTGTFFAVIIPLLFAIIPVYIFLFGNT